MAPEDQARSNRVLVTMARNKLRQHLLYDARITAISHFYAETQGRRVLKPEIVEKDLTLEKEDFMRVSKFSFYSLFVLNCIICS